MADSSYYWYKNSKPYEDVFSYVKQLDTDQGYVQSDNVRNMRLYGNSDGAFGPYKALRAEPSSSTQNRVTFNVVQSMVDTAHSKVTKNKPRPYFLTDGGDWSLKRKAQKLTQFLDGAFYHTDFYVKAATAFKHACIFGTGCVKLYVQDNDLMAEQVFIDEIVIDNQEALYGPPRQMHQKKWVNKDVLKALFPKSAGMIESAIANISDIDKEVENKTDLVLVIESWKLPSKRDAKDGRHTICISNDTLFTEKWEKDYFPFVFFRWSERPVGFFGQGISEQLTGIQLEINKILRTIQVSMHLVSVPKIFVEASSKIVDAQLNNKIGGIIKYAGTPPTEGKLGTVPTELFTHLDRLYQRAYSIIGISQLSAQAQKPSGLNSGKALRVYNDLETERFLSVGRQYEQAFLDAGDIMIDLTRDIAEATGNFTVKVPNGRTLAKIDWTDVCIDESDYMMQCFPTSALSQEPAARLQEVQELMQAGLVDKTIGLKLLDYPDLRSYYDMANAGTDDIERQIELIVDKQEYQSPEPYQNLTLGIKMMQDAYLMYRAQKAPEETLDLFRRWMDESNELIKASQAPAPGLDPMAAVGPDGQPLAAPTAPPVSDLLPNAPSAA